VIREQPAIDTQPVPESVEQKLGGVAEALHPEPVSGTSSTGIAPGKKRYYRFYKN
jgi:hypothetical protein